MRSEAPNQEPRGGWWVPLALILTTGLLFFIAGCSPRIVEHITVQRDTVRIVKVDSIYNYQHDSVFVRERGDTVYKYVEHIRYRDRVKVDTFVRVKVDSVAVERIKEVQVEQPLSWWKRAQIGSFWWLVGAVLALLLWTTRKLWLKLFML